MSFCSNASILILDIEKHRFDWRNISTERMFPLETLNIVKFDRKNGVVEIHLCERGRPAQRPYI